LVLKLRPPPGRGHRPGADGRAGGPLPYMVGGSRAPPREGTRPGPPARTAATAKPWGACRGADELPDSVFLGRDGLHLAPAGRGRVGPRLAGPDARLSPATAAATSRSRKSRAAQAPRAARRAFTPQRTLLSPKTAAPNVAVHADVPTARAQRARPADGPGARSYPGFPTPRRHHNRGRRCGAPVVGAPRRAITPRRKLLSPNTAASNVAVHADVPTASV